ncbi:LuxR C-terminal-related transcriptional regulator [Streptomyces sp. NPDC001544]|uniref:helix-turn-helix transcriptional regulator n=1 Tax=Streptomyces sp. NPDC001544 TaxID=3364584 RepID=UPI00369F4213
MPVTERQRGAALPRTHEPVDLGFGELRGRERELAVIEGWLDHGQARELTLTGPAGVGKSHLAHAAVSARARTHDLALVWADLAGAEDGGAVWARLGVRTASEAAERVGTTRLLLVLDNADRVVTDIALDVSELLRACPLLRILLTSRVPLDIRAERIMPVGPLPTGENSPAEAVWADSVRPYFSAVAGNRPAGTVVADICRRLDGIPLAIEMAAEAVGTEGPRALLERLTRGEFPGRSRPRDTPERHRSLSSALTWGAGVLSDGDRMLLRDLSVFETYVDLAAVRGMTGLDDLGAVAGIESLVSKSLLLSTPGRAGSPEFRLTHMARCHYRAELARDARELGRVLDRHAAHWAAFADTMATALYAGRPVDQVLHLVEPRLPDILKAVRHLSAREDHIGVLRLLTALEGPLLRHRLAPETAETIERAALAWTAATSGKHPTDEGADGVEAQRLVVVEALVAVVRWMLGHGDHQRAERVLDRAVAAAGESAAAQVRVAAFTGELLRRRGESAAAAVLLDSAIQRSGTPVDRHSAAVALRARALLAAGRGDLEAEQPLLKALDLVDDARPAGAHAPCGEPPAALRASLLTALARVRRVLGRHQEAYEAAREGVRLLMGTGDPDQVAEALETMAVTSPGGGGDEERCHAVARLLAYAEAIRLRYGTVTDDRAAVGVLTERLTRNVGAAPLRRLRRDAEQISLYDALVAALLVPPPAPEPSARAGAQVCPYELTRRQYEIALLVAEGLTNRQIARRLGISEWTVTNHLRVVMQKLDCTSRVHVARAVQRDTR